MKKLLLLSIIPAISHAAMFDMPTWDKTKLMVPATGNNTTLNDLSYLTSPPPHSQDGTGAFRISCKPSHMLPDDPIVYPGQQGASHLHTYFGNTSVNAFTNLTNLVNQGSSTCSVGTGNRSAYWVPTIIDTADGTPLYPYEIFMYYKSGYQRTDSTLIQPFPNGFRMIAGDASSTNPIQRYDYTFNCNNAPGILNIPACSQNGFVTATIDFKQCWDGVNLDSPNHKSHVANPDNIRQPNGSYKGVCPATHPVLLPKLSFVFRFRVTKPEGTENWRLSSDAYPKVGYNAGYSYHADVVFGWKPALMDSIVTNCLRKNIDCDGLYSIPSPTP